MFAPDGDHVVLVRFRQRWLLVDRRTREVAQVRATLAQPGLHCAPNGWGYMDVGSGEAKWTATLFRHHVLSRAGPTLVATQRTSRGDSSEQEATLLPVCDMVHFHAERYALKYHLAVGRMAAVSEFRIGLYVWPQDGAHMFWDLQALHTAFGGKHFHRQYKFWRAQAWHSWLKYVSAIALPEHHLRAKLSVHTADDLEASTARGFCAGAVASTHALIALLARWAFAASRSCGFWEEGACPAASLLASLCDKIEDGEVKFCRSWQLEADLPYAMYGCGVVTCSIQQGHIELPPTMIVFLQNTPRHGLMDMSSLRGRPLVLDSLKFLARSGSAFSQIMGQCVWQLGTHVESVILRRTYDKSEGAEWWATNPYVTNLTASADLHLLEKKRRLAQYAADTEVWIRGTARVTVMLDWSRVGRRGVGLFAVADATNFAAFLAPQIHMSSQQALFQKLLSIY